MSGPLSGIRVLEIAGLGAAPFCGMILADLGAEVIRVDRTHGGRGTDPGADRDSFVDRGRRSIALNLKSPEGVAILLRLVETSDALIEAFRPGVAERLGFGPEACLMRNEKLIYGRMTGWGQNGPLFPRVTWNELITLNFSGEAFTNPTFPYFSSYMYR